MSPRSGVSSNRQTRRPRTSANGFEEFIAKLGLAAAGAAFTIVAQIVIRRASERSATFRDGLDEVCEDTADLATAAGKYWAADPAAPDFHELEARVFGLNHRLMALTSLLGEQNEEFRSATLDAVIDLSDAATGGNFQVRNRAAEPQRYIRVEQRATSLTKDVRRLKRRLLRGWLW